MAKQIQHVVYDVAIKSPLDIAHTLSQELGCSVYMKREDLQPTHSFKIRGAYNKMAKLSKAQLKSGVITASAGNHAQGVALSAKILGTKARIVMPVTTPDVKIVAVKDYGAEVILHGNNYSEAAEHSEKLAKTAAMTYVHPFDDVEVIEGQGTIATELLEQLPTITHLFVPVGGGGLLSGVLGVIKRRKPNVVVVGVEPEDSDVMGRSLKANKRITLGHVGIFADGVAVARVGEHTLKAASSVDAMITVSDDETCLALTEFVKQTHATLETAGALGLAGVKAYAKQFGFPQGSKVVTVCSGSNIDTARLLYALNRAEIANDHNVLFRIHLPERPGALRTLCSEIITSHNITQFEYRKDSSRPDARIAIGLRMSLPTGRATITQLLDTNNYTHTDLSNSRLIREHGIQAVGDRPDFKHELFYSVEFADRPGALLELLEALVGTWNITMFHYGGSAGDTGRVLIGFEYTDRKMLESILKQHTHYYSRAHGDIALMYG